MAKEQEQVNKPNVNVTLREHALKTGDVILGRYRVVSELGRGGMGVVYLCRDQIANVEVAVKGLPPEVSHNSDEMENILQNYQLVRALRHENIAAVTNLECDEKSGDYFLVMDCAEGMSLKRWMFEHAGLSCWRRKVSVLRQIAGALDYAHRAKPRHIIHRDVKPANIMVDDTGCVKVLDFGLAAQIRSSLSRVSMEVTSRSGTPSYKSPEQWQAQPQREASDQYSLGVIAYQMLSDVLPFDNDNPTVMREAVINDPVPEVRELTHSVNRVLAKALSKHAEDRYVSCTAFVDAIEKALKNGEGVSDEGRQSFVLPESTPSSAVSERSEVKIVLPEVPAAHLVKTSPDGRELAEIQKLCRGYRTLLAESVTLHQKRGDEHTAAVLRRLQEMVREAVPNADGTGDLDELVRIFVYVGREYRRFLRKRQDYAYFMEHRRSALLFQKGRTSENAVTRAIFESIG